MVRRWILNILAWLSLVLCLASVVMWVRSYWVYDVAVYTSTEGKLVRSRHTVGWVEHAGPTGHVFKYYRFASDRGVLSVAVHRVQFHPGEEILEVPRARPLPAQQSAASSLTVRGIKAVLQRLGLHIQRHNLRGKQALWIDVPHWAVTVLTAILPVLLAVRQRRQRRRKELGLCLTCGYDLRASKQRCAECGTPIAANPSGDTSPPSSLAASG